MKAAYVLWQREQGLEQHPGQLDEPFERDYVKPALAELNALFQIWLVQRRAMTNATQNQEN